MYLKSIKINGFKSFVDKTNIELENGITGIVGPNGSGKSNIVDAIRWVLGEQSVKSLRGDSSMSDVIFFGSKTRNPSNNASVTLVFDNTDHTLKLDYSEVAIKRIIYKTGENEYYINNEKVRLKDIVELLLDSGSAKESFSIISQGDVSNIINAKPEDRRVIFESASGVLKYKKRKEEASKKLEKTHDNIDRVNDIILELETQIEPLKEQSDKAKKYEDTKEELKNVEISLIVNDLDNINLTYLDSKNKIENLNNDLIELNTSNSSFDAKLSEKKIELANINNNIYKLQDELVTISSEVERLNGEKNIVSERNKYKVDDVKLHNNILILTEEKVKYTSEIDSLNKEIDDINNELKNSNSEFEKISREKENITLEKKKLSDQYNIKEKTITDNEYKITNLENIIESNSIYPYAVKTILSTPKLVGICDTIGNIINTKDEYKTAIDTAIGGSSSFIITEDVKTATKAIEFLKENRVGRATFFPLDVIKEKTIDLTTYNIIKDLDGYIDIASNIVSYDDKYKNIVLNVLGNIIVVRDLKSANMISKKIDHKYRIVSLEGEIIHVGGSLSGGNNKKSTSVILDKMELEKLRKENVKLKNTIDEIDINLSNLNEQEDRIMLKLDNIKRKIIYSSELLSIKENNINDLKKKLLYTKSSIKSINNTIEGVSNEEEKIISMYYKAIKEKDLIVSKINKENNSKKDLEDDINLLEHSFKETNSEYYKKQNELKELEIKVGKLDVKLDSLLNILTETYNLTYEKAKEDYTLVIEESSARKKVNDLKKIINDLGVVNIGAIEEYERVKNRYEFLNNQKNDLFKAENTLLEIIKEMDIVMTSEFKETFKLIKYEFKNVFKELFKGGDADLILTNPDDVLTTGVDIVALPPGKKLKSIVSLSGGEQALTSIALLFAILRVRPVPFCILDEVEAPLDEANVDVFGSYIERMKYATQFILITHKKKTMEYADVLYGVTMQEAGVSKLVSVRLEELK